MFFDPDNDPFEALNDPETLDDTPIGLLLVLLDDGMPVVYVMDAYDPTFAVAPIHFLQRGEHPSAAVYGKRVLERELVFRRCAADKQMKQDARRSQSKLLAGDAGRELRRFANERHHDAHEAIAAVLGVRR